MAIDGVGGVNVLVANYDSATVASLPIDGEGRLGEAVSVMKQEGSGPVAGRQGHSYPHSINFSGRDGRFAFRAGFRGRIGFMCYRFNGVTGAFFDGGGAGGNCAYRRGRDRGIWRFIRMGSWFI